MVGDGREVVSRSALKIRIKIQFRDGKSNVLIVSGESYRTSMARRSPEEMIKETLEEILKNRK